MIVVAAGNWADELLAALERRDPDAIALIRRLLPSTLPPAARRTLRDSQIKTLAALAFASFPGSSTHSIASLIAIAGRRIEIGQSATASPFSMMDDRLKPFVQLIQSMLAWLPTNGRSGRRWPTARTVFDILAN